MHGTGTSLGDPIEVGAVAAVFGQHTSAAAAARPALGLITSKSSLGHAEPAAGIVGVLHSLLAVQQGALPPLIHLRTLNPFVESALEPGSSRGAFLLPRQFAPRVVCGGSEGQALVSGVSSFAFQVRLGWWTAIAAKMQALAGRLHLLNSKHHVVGACWD